MGASASRQKVKGLLLPAQSGKTRKVEELITRFSLISELLADGDLNVFISANNRLLVSQTESRFRADLGASSDEEEAGPNDAVIEGTIFSWMSGTKKSNISPMELAFRILKDIEMIIMCAHSKRMQYLNETLRLLASLPLFTKRVNIWIDEADASINLWSKYSEILDLPCINQVTLVSATFHSIFNKYKRLHIIPYEVTHPECYRRLKDSVRHTEDLLAFSAQPYVKAVIEKHPELVRPGARAFIPGSTEKASHEAIAAYLLGLGFSVIILNGDKKELRIPGQAAINLRPYLSVDDPEDVPDEFNKTLATLYAQNNLAERPLAITGFMCVERGVTFQCGPEEGVHNGFLFDYAIIPPIADKAEAYQAMARVFGNVGHIPGYSPVHIYTNSATFTKVEQQEEIAVNLARVVHENALEEVDKHTYKHAATYERIRTINTFFVPCDKDTVVAELKKYNITTTNPFTRAEAAQAAKGLDKIPGYLAQGAGDWRVFQYEDVASARWGINDKTDQRITICYRNDVLGVCVRTCREDVVRPITIRRKKPAVAANPFDTESE